MVKSLTALAQFLPRNAAIKGMRAWMAAKNTVKYRDPYFFQQVFIEINRHCNRHCVYCPNVSVPQPEWFMPNNDFMSILERLHEIRWSGPVSYHCLSEPTLHPRLAEFIQFTAGMLPHSIPVLFTNGDFLTVAMAAELINCGLKRCTITNHPPLKEGWMERMMELYHKWPNVFRIQKLGSDVIMKSGDYTKIKLRQRPVCRSPQLMLAIRWDGDYGLCHCDPLNLHSFGNVKTHHLLEAWRAIEWTDVRKRLRQGYRDYEICKKCDGVI